MSGAPAYDARPWLALYNAERPRSIVPDFTDALAMFRAAVARAADRPAIAYFDGNLSFADVDAQSDALACALIAEGFAPGDRLGLYLQNTPHFAIGALAAWKAGGIAVPINPMNRQRELGVILDDSGATALLTHRHLYRDVAREVLATRPRVVAIATDERDFQTRDDTRVLPAERVTDIAGALDFGALVRRYAGSAPVAVEYASGDTALIVYTSGTTGVPKGAMNTHGNVTFSAQTYRDWIGVTEGAPVYGIAPLFHITGLEGALFLAVLTASPLVLHYRFDTGVALEAVREHRAAFTVGAITAFIALMNAPGANREDLATLEKIYSGGAPIPPSVVAEFETKFGHTIHNAYGLTETTSPVTMQPLGLAAPVDETSGSLAIGVPVYDTSVYIVDEAGRPVAAGEVGEIAVSGPQVIAGYWRKPEETERTLP
ncbi:MAG: AMP-binding protein, partial [Candidatus Eremiobacteraeota bacterium]|nr:AMP-binding protein [Candidatus Eremiobacteraeota bacterium]